MDKLVQHLNFRDSDQRLWNTIEAEHEVHDNSQHVTEDFYDQPKHMFYNAEFFEGMPIIHSQFVNLLTIPF